MNTLFFSPSIGKDYARGGIFSKKVLAVGESHYCGTDVMIAVYAEGTRNVRTSLPKSCSGV